MFGNKELYINNLIFIVSDYMDDGSLATVAILTNQ